VVRKNQFFTKRQEKVRAFILKRRAKGGKFRREEEEGGARPIAGEDRRNATERQKGGKESCSSKPTAKGKEGGTLRASRQKKKIETSE